MSQPLRLLILDDNAHDAELMVHEVRRTGFEPNWRRVDSEEAFLTELKTPPDVILADYAMPQFDGLRALALVRERQCDTPFILISGTLGEEAAVEAMRLGASDYLLKDRIARLGFAIQRALDEKRLKDRHLEAADALRASEEKFRTLMESLEVVVWLSDPDINTLFYVNPAYERIWGRTCASLYAEPRSFLDAIHPADSDAVTAHLEAHSRGNWDQEYRILRPDGSCRWIRDKGCAIAGKDGRIDRVAGFAMDITAHRLAEENSRQLACAVEQSPVSIVITNREGEIEFVNPRFTEVTGYSLQEVRGRNPRFLKSGTFSADDYRQLWETITAGRVWQGVFHNCRKDGTHFWETASISPLRNSKGDITHFVAVKEDVTEKRQMEAKLLRAQRVESIGSLASGIAHDLNNILAPIILCAPLLRLEETPEERLELVQTIEVSAQRAVEIVKQLLSFARGKEGQRMSIQLRHLIREVARIARETFPRNIEIKEFVAADLWPVVADATQFHQVLLNLCVNARDAMPSGGTLSLHAVNLNLDDHYAAMHPKATVGPYVRLRVQDTGVGIAEDLQQHIFESFFTTKAEGMGTGLGLTTVLGIVQDHGGFITFSSRVNEGTVFEIHLPAVPDFPTLSSESPQQVASPTQGAGELVMVVDDESTICAATQRTLERHGYRTLQARDGIEALALFTAHAEEVGAVVTDFMMPLMDGVTLCRALRAISPRTPVIVSSGGLFGKVGSDAQRAFSELGITHILQKPHTATPLLRALAEVLQPKRPSPPRRRPGPSA